MNDEKLKKDLFDGPLTHTQYLEHLRAIIGDITGCFDRYVEQGIEPGSFARAVLENDFVGAALRADTWNSVTLKKIAEYVKFYIPYDCWGSREIVEKWIKEKKTERNKNDL